MKHSNVLYPCVCHYLQLGMEHTPNHKAKLAWLGSDNTAEYTSWSIIFSFCTVISIKFNFMCHYIVKREESTSSQIALKCLSADAVNCTN